MPTIVYPSMHPSFQLSNEFYEYGSPVTHHNSPNLNNLVLLGLTSCDFFINDFSIVLVLLFLQFLLFFSIISQSVMMFQILWHNILLMSLLLRSRSLLHHHLRMLQQRQVIRVHKLRMFYNAISRSGVMKINLNLFEKANLLKCFYFSSGYRAGKMRSLFEKPSKALSKS